MKSQISRQSHVRSERTDIMETRIEWEILPGTSKSQTLDDLIFFRQGSLQV